MMIKTIAVILSFTISIGCIEEKSSSFIPDNSRFLFIKIFAKSGLNLRKEPNSTSEKIKLLKDGEIGIFLGYKNEIKEVSGIKGYWYNVEFGNFKGFIFSPYSLLSYNKDLLKDMDYADSSIGTILPVLNILPSFPLEKELAFGDIWLGKGLSDNSLEIHSKKIVIQNNFEISISKKKDEEYTDYNVVFENQNGKIKFTSNLNNLEPYQYSTQFPIVTGGVTQCHNCDGTTLTQLFILKENKILSIPHWSDSSSEICNNSEEQATITEIRISRNLEELHLRDSRYECKEIDDLNCEFYHSCKNNPPIFFKKIHLKSYYIKIKNHNHDLIIDGEISRGQHKEIDFTKYFNDTIPLEFKRIEL